MVQASFDQLVSSRALLPVEARVLLLSLAETPHDLLLEELERPDLDWGRLIWLAGKEKASSHLWKVLRQLPGGSIPPERLAELQRVATAVDFRTLHLQGQLVRVLRTLEAVGIDTVLLKGAGLAATAYPTFIARPMYDLDLLVRREQGQAAWDALRAAGWIHNEATCPAAFYVGHHHLPPLDDPVGMGIAVELHTAPWSGAVELSTEAIWREARAAAVGGREVLVPCANHQILHIATHFAWGHGLRMGAWRAFEDLRQLIAAGDVKWTEFVELAREARGGTCCYWTFSVARRLAGVPVPEFVTDALRPQLPSSALEALERHFIGAMFHFGPAQCPSDRVGKMLWTAAMAPRRSGHGRVRPWSRETEWVSLSGAPRSQRLRDRLRHHLAQVATWRSYVGAVLMPPQASRS